MKFCFGPVLSRRLGRSFGVDILPRKTCNLNCVYCEIGPTRQFFHERKEYIPTEEIIKELEIILPLKEKEIDILTFTASGEPCLHSGLGAIINFSRKLIKKPVAVLTNSTLFHLKDVRDELSSADILLPSLDAVHNKSFRKVNRPCPEVRLEDIIEGLETMAREFSGEMWLEVLLVKDLNDSVEAVSMLAEAIKKISPHRVQLNTVARPPADPCARPLSRRELKEIRDLMQKGLDMPVEVIVEAERHMKEGFQPMLEAEIMDMLSRRPLTMEEIQRMLESDPKSTKRSLENMMDKHIVLSKRHEGRTFYLIKDEKRGREINVEDVH